MSVFELLFLVTQICLNHKRVCRIRPAIKEDYKMLKYGNNNDAHIYLQLYVDA